MYKLDRREFLGLVGSLSLFTFFGCDGNKEEKNIRISHTDLTNYELLTCQKGYMIVKYEPEVMAFNVIKLDNINDSLEEFNIFHREFDDNEKCLDDFFIEYGVVDSTSALYAFEELYGKKSYYSIDEVTRVIEQPKVISKKLH